MPASPGSTGQHYENAVQNRWLIPNVATIGLWIPSFQDRKDRNAGNGMAIVLGRLRPCSVFDYRFVGLIENNIPDHVKALGQHAKTRLNELKNRCPEIISAVRGQGLLLLADFPTEEMASEVTQKCLQKGLLVTQTNGMGIRIFPALNITKQTLDEGLDILNKALAALQQKKGPFSK